MRIFGSSHYVRPYWLHTEQYGKPYLLDRRTFRLTPYLGDADCRLEWEFHRECQIQRKERERQIQQAREELRGACPRSQRNILRRAALFDRGDGYCLQMLRDTVIGAATDITLDSNYAAGSAGDAIGMRWLQATGSKNLDTVYFYIVSYTGTAANVNDISVELRPEPSAGAATPDTATLTEGEVVDPASATGWIAVSGFSSAVSAFTRYWICIGDADGNGTDNAVIRRSAPIMDLQSSANVVTVRCAAASTTTGWASGNTFSSAPAAIVLKFSDSSVFGTPLTTNTAPASDTNRRGLRITTSGLIRNEEIFGFLWTSASANISGGEIWTGDTGPSGTADNVSTDILYGGGAGNTRIGFAPSGGAVYTLLAGTAYSIVATYSAGTTAGPQRMDIGTGETADLRSAMPGGGHFYYRRANGTTNWDNDLVGSLPPVALLLDGQVAAAASSTSRGGHIIGGGM